MAQDRYDLLAQRLSAEYDDLPTTGAELKKWFKDDSTRAGQLYDVMTKDGMNTGAKSKDAFVNFYGSGGYAMGQQPVNRSAGQKTGASLQDTQTKPFAQPSFNKQPQQETEEPVDYPRRPTSYTDQGALFRLNDERTQRNADIARNVLEQNPVIKEQKRKSQPVTTTGTPADQYVIKTQGQFEDEVHQSAADNARKLFGTGVDYEVGRVIDDATKRWEKAFDPRGMVGEGAEISALTRANQEIDPERLTQDLTNELKNRIGGWLQQEGKPEALVEEANRLGISPDDYANMVVNEITSQAQQKLDQKVLEGYMPKGKADYIINGLHDSLIGTLMDMTTMTKGQRQMMQRANQQYSEQNKKDSQWGGTITDLVRGGVGFMGDAPVFGALGKVASPMVRGTGALLENMGVRTTMGMSDAAFQRLSQTVLNNSSWLQRIKFGADRAIAGSAYNFGLYEGMGNVVNDLSVGDDTSLGTLAGDFIEGFAKGSAKGAVLGAFSRPAQAVSPKFGVRSDMGIGQKVLVGTGKGALHTGNIMAEGLGFTAGEYLVDEAARERVKNSDNPLNVILQDTMENTMMAGIFKIMNGHNMLHPVESMRKAFEASADSRFGFQEWQKKEIEDAYGSKESFVKTMEDIARSADSERNTKMSRFYEDFINRNDISWDTKNKVSALLTGNMATVPPIPSRISIDQDKKEVVAFGRNGEVLFRKGFENQEDADAIKAQLDMSRDEQMLHNLIGTFLVKDKDGNVNPESQKQLDDAITEIGFETALNQDGMINALNKAPEKRTEIEQHAIDELFNRLYEVRFPANQPHPAQDHQDGRDLADKTLNIDELDPAKNPNGVEPGKYDQLTQAYDEANKTLEEVFKKDDTFYQFVKEQRANGLSDGEIALEARKMAFGEEEAQALIDYERAKEQMNGYIELTAERIDEYVSNEVSGMVFKGELDGQPVNDRFVRVVDDEGNTYYLRTGKVTVGEDGRLVSTDGSGTVIVRDANGKDKMVRADSVSMAPEDPENPMRDNIAAYSQLRSTQLEEAISLAIDADGKLQQPSEPKSQGQLAYEQEQGDVEQNGGLVRNGLADQTLSETLRGSLHKLGRKIGKKIQVVTKDELKQINPSAPDNARGMRSADNKTLYLVSDYVKDSDYMQRFVTGHELTHSIKAESGDGKVWNSFVDAVREHMGDKAFDEAVKHVEDLYEKSGVHLDRNGAIEEVCSDWAGDNLMQDEASIRHIVESMEKAGHDAVTFTQRVKQLFNDMIAAITGSGRTLSSDEKAQLERLVKARDLWEQMYNECVAKNEARDKAAEAKRLAEEKAAEERKAREDNGVEFGADGEADYLRMTPDATIADLSEQAGPELVGSVVGTMLKNAEKALKGIKDVKPASEKPSDVIAAAKETAAMRKAAQEAVDYWKSVSERQKEMEAEAKAEAKRKAEEEARLQAEAERQERLKTPEGRAAEIAKAKVEDRPKVAQEIYGEAFNGDMTPNGVDEYIMSYFGGEIPELGKGFIDTDSFESETGHKVDGFSGDSKAYYPYLAGRGKGKTLKQVAEEIWHSMPEAMHEMTNDADIMNKVSQLLTNADKTTDIRDALLNSRIREAERVLSGESRKAEEQETEAEVEEPAGGGMTTEMPFAPFEGEAPFSLEKAAEQNGASYSLVEDPAEMERLDKEKKIKVYRSIQLDKNGNARSPIASKLGKGSEKVATSGIEIGQWEKADEHPELADENGKIVLDKGEGNGTLTVAYNPYIHTSRSMINDQFSSAWKRDNIVVIETEVPESELTAGYHADKAKDAVGEHAWKAGPVGRKLPEDRQRKVILSRWDKPVRTVSWEEVADDYARTLEGLDIEVPFNVIPKSLLPLLVERGIKIGEPEKGNAGDAARPAYEAWKKENSQYSLSEDPIKAIEQSAEKFRKEKEEWKPTFYSNAQKAVEGIKQDKATPEQWLAMLQKNGGLKAGEDKWLGLSDWLKEKKGSVTKQEIEDYIRQNQIQVEETNYKEHFNVDDNPQMMEFRKEFDDLVKKYEDEKNAIEQEANAFNDEMYQKYGEGWANDPDRLSKEDQKRNDDIIERYHQLWDEDVQELAFKEMMNKYGDDFDLAFEVNYGNGKLDPTMDMYGDNISDSAKHFLEFEEQPINSTRLDYTTEGLDNKREIALTVPTVEPYKEGDNVHFGDAGEGRAVAWVRFGETTDKDGKKVLVIDEIQSKRHQDARENGYENGEMARVHQQAVDAQQALDEYRRHLYEERGIEPQMEWPSDMTKEENEKFDELFQAARDAQEEEYESKQKNKKRVPDAPFEKNWHELAMKRMLRYAAENGYDKIAWTTGEQQSDRYDLSHQIDEIQSIRNGGGYQVSAMKDGNAVFENWYDSESKLAEDFGKDIANKVFSNQEVGNKQSFKGLDLKVGGEGMAGFYDQILPRFMDKYGKKWGVKTGEIDLPDLEKSAQKMHSVDVTPEMKESVMQGQPMFSLAGKDSAEEIKPVGTGDFGDIYDQFKGKPKEAIDFLLKKKSGEAVGALSHKDVGDIDLVWGEEGEGKSDGFGLAKLAKYHPEVLDNLQEILDSMTVKKRGTNRIRLHSKTHEAAISLNYYGKEKKWLLTAYEKENPSATDKTMNTAGNLDDSRSDTALPRTEGISESKDTKNTYSLQENKEEKAKINTSDPLEAISQAAEDFRKEKEEERKKAQFDIIQKTNPKDKDLNHTWIEKPEDVKTFQETFEDGGYDINEDLTPDFTSDMAKKAIETGKIKVYSSHRIKDGEFVTPSEMEAKNYAGEGKVYSKNVPLEDVAWIDPTQGQYAKVDDSKYSLIGSKGAESMDKAEGTTRRIDDRRTAEEMENAGKDSKTIWAATGWARGKDGKWRYEIPDFKEFSAAGIVEYKKEHPATMEERKRFTELNYKKVDGEDGYGEPLTEEELQEWAGLKAKINPTGYAKEQGKLPDFIDAPELFEAYPALKDMPVEVVDLGGEFSGMYTDDGSILLDKSRVDKAINGSFDESLSANAELKDTMVHEIQHAIQAIEGFARGDNPHRLVSGSEIGDDAYNRSAGEVEARNTEKRRLMSERHRKKTIPEKSEDTPREDQIVYTGESDGEKFSLTEDTSDPIKTIERASNAWKEERKVFGTKPKVHAETSHGGRVAIEDNKEPSIEDEYAHYSLSPSPTNTPLQTDENRRYHELIGGKAFDWIEAHQNDLQSVIAMQKAILGDNVDAKDYENVFYAMNHMGGVVMQKENNYARHYYSRINNAANEAAAKMRGNDKNKKYQEAMDEVEDYIMMKHGLERNRSLYVRDHADDQAKADFANLMDSLYNDLRARRITFADYLSRMDDFIRSRVDSGYTADKHDMSGLSNKNAAGYDDAAMTKEVMDTEALYGEALTDELWDSINSATDYILNERYESGLMSKAEKERLERQWHFYVPLQGWAEPTAEEMFDYTDHMMTSVGSPVLKRAGGRTSKADDPLAMIGANASRLIRDAELNRVHQTAVRLSRGHAGNGLLEEMQTWYEKTGTDASGNPIWEEAFPQWAPNATADDITQAIQQFNADMQAKQQSGDARKTKRGLNIRYPMAVPSHVRQHIINAWIGGEKVRLYVQGNPRAAQALNGELRQGTDNKFVKGWDAVNRLMMGLNTSYNPEFIVSNGERDLEMATNNLLVKEGREYTGRFLKNYFGIGGSNTTGNTGLLKGETLGMGSIGKRIDAFNGIWNRYYNNALDLSKDSDRMFKEFMDNGGPTGYVTNQNLDKYKKQLYQGVREKDGNFVVKAMTKLLADPFSWALNSIEELNTRVENLTRFAAYQTSRQGGRSILQSIHDAKEVSVNFGTRGAGGNTSGAAGATAAWGRHTFYFYNAGVQSLEMYARNIRKHPIKGVATMMLKPFMAGCAVALWNMLNGADDETGEKSYAQLNPWVRRNNLIIPAGEGAYWTYPLPIEIRAFYGMGEAAAGMFFEETRDPNPALTMAGQITQMIPIDVLSYMSEQPKDITDLALRFGTALLPSVIQSDIVQPAVNMNFYGAPIEKEPNPFDEFQPRWGRTFMRDQNTSVYRAAKWLEQNTRTSPSEHSDPDSPEMTKQQKGYIDISPALAKHMIDNIFGGTGAWVMRLGDATRNGWEWLADDGDNPFNNSRSIPFVRTNYRSATHDRGEGRQRARMYDLNKMMKNVEDNLKFYYKDKDVNPEHYLRFMELWDSEDGQIYREFHKDLKTIDSYDRKVKHAPEGEAKRNAQRQLNEKRKVLLEQIDNKRKSLEKTE